MKLLVCPSLSICALLAGCSSQPVSGTAEAPRGRYTGVGLYSADSGWRRIQADESDAAKGASKRADDTMVIVVVDTHTGEVRQCGNLSGRCVAMNPWGRAPGKGESLPLVLGPEPVSNEVANVTE